MHETTSDLQKLQDVLDRSYAGAGEHLLSIHTPERRLSAEQLAEQLTGMCLLTLATVTRDGRPITGPVDGIFFRGAFHFGSSPQSFRFRHIRARPQVSATHLPGEHLSVTVHGRAGMVDWDSDDGDAFRRTVIGIYAPRYGDEWEEMLEAGATYARIEPERMFTFWMPEA